MKIMIILLAFIATSNVYSQTADRCKPLDDTILKIMNKKLYNFSSFNKIYNSSRITKCDDGAFAESMSHIVVQALILDFVRTIKVAGKNKEATYFLLSHLSPSNDGSDLRKVMDNATKMCPNKQRELCKNIMVTSKNAIKE